MLNFERDGPVLLRRCKLNVGCFLLFNLTIGVFFLLDSDSCLLFYTSLWHPLRRERTHRFKVCLGTHHAAWRGGVRARFIRTFAGRAGIDRTARCPYGCLVAHAWFFPDGECSHPAVARNGRYCSG